MAEETERVRRIYDRTADRYDKRIAFFERLLFGDVRRWVCSRARGDVLAVGTGRNLLHYPADVHVTGVDVSPAMLRIARRRADGLGRPVDLHVCDVQRLAFPDRSFDTVVCTLALCTIPDPGTAVAEAARVLQPGGRLVLLEHVRSPLLPVRVAQRTLEPLSVRLEADHLLREPLAYAAAAGLEVETLERSRWGIVERLAARKRV